MLTLPNRAAGRASTGLDDLDLDENVDTMSYAKNLMPKEAAEDSMPMLPLQESVQPATETQIFNLNQRRFHSWDRYLAEGQDLFRRLPRRQELVVVEAFKDGLYNAQQKKQCEQWLDLNGWIWESIISFGTSTQMPGMQRRSEQLRDPSTEETRVPSHAKVRFAEPKELKTPAPKPEKPQVKSNKEAQKPKSQPTANTQARRRSQRLLENERASQAQREASLVAEVSEKMPKAGSRPAVVGSLRARSRMQKEVDCLIRNTVSMSASPSPRTAKAQRSTHVSALKADEPHKKTEAKRVAPVQAQSKMPGPQRSTKKEAKPVIPGAPKKATRRIKPDANQPPVSAQRQHSLRPSTPIKVRQEPKMFFRDIEPTAPRLVKRKRAEALGQDDSDGDVILPRQPVTPAAAPRPSSKKRRLALPPPPAIPILPTSDE